MSNDSIDSSVRGGSGLFPRSRRALFSVTFSSLNCGSTAFSTISFNRHSVSSPPPICRVSSKSFTPMITLSKSLSTIVSCVALIAAISTKVFTCGGIPVSSVLVSHEWIILTWPARILVCIEEEDWRYIIIDLAMWFGGNWRIVLRWNIIEARHRCKIRVIPSMSWCCGKLSFTASSANELNSVLSPSKYADEHAKLPLNMLSIAAQRPTNSSPPCVWW